MFEAGLDVRALDFRQIFSERGVNGLITDTIHCGISFEPDFILINKGEKFTPAVLKEIKQSLDVPIFLFYGDKRQEWPEVLTRCLPYYDAFLINSDDEDEKRGLERYKPKKVVYHHTATDLDTFQKDLKIDEMVDVAFFGSNYNNIFPESAVRRDWLMRLKTEPGISVMLYGHGWDGTAKNVLFGADYAEAASRAKVLVGFNAFNDINYYTSNRAFNSMGCGTFVSSRWKGCEEMFTDGKEIAYFSSYSQMVERIRELINDNTLRRKMYLAGRKRLKQEHTYKVRAQQLMNLAKEYQK